jgi:hypothetical protein
MYLQVLCEARGAKGRPQRLKPHPVRRFAARLKPSLSKQID